MADTEDLTVLLILRGRDEASEMTRRVKGELKGVEDQASSMHGHLGAAFGGIVGHRGTEATDADRSG